MSLTVENHIRDSKEIHNQVKGKNRMLFICKLKKANQICTIKLF